MIFRPQPFYRFKVIFVFLVVRLKFLRIFLSKRIKDELPVGWNNHMFWVAFKSNGKKFFYDYYIKLKKPASYKSKISVADEYKLTEKDIRHFYEKGYIKPFQVMSTTEAEKMQQHLEHLVNEKENKIHARGSYKFERENKLNHNETSEETKEFVHKRLNGKNRHLEDAKLLNLSRHPAIVERCAQLLGGEDLLMWRTAFFPIPPKSPGTDWHQGSTWMLVNWKESTLHPPKINELFQVTFWIALTDTHKKKACLATVSGSQWEMYPSKYKLDSKKPSVAHGEYDAEVDHTIKPEDINYIEMKAGECVIFSERALHGSSDNLTDEWRWAVNGRVVRTDTRIYTEKMLREGSGMKVWGIKNLNLDNWRAVLVRGKDRYGYNRLLKEDEMPVEDSEQQRFVDASQKPAKIEDK